MDSPKSRALSLSAVVLQLASSNHSNISIEREVDECEQVFFGGFKLTVGGFVVFKYRVGRA